MGITSHPDVNHSDVNYTPQLVIFSIAFIAPYLGTSSGL